MDDRIAEIRPDYGAAWAVWVSQPSLDDLDDDEALAHLVEIVDAAIGGLLDSDALIIRRDDEGAWPKWAVDAVASEITSTRPYRLDARKALDALASSRGAEPTPDDVEQLWKELHPDSERHP